MLLRQLMSVVLTIIFIAACSSQKSYSTDTTSDTATSAATLYSQDTETLTEDSTDEVSDEEECQSNEPDFEAIKEKLVAKLTSLLEKLSAIDSSEFDEEQLEFHNSFIAIVTSDLATVNAATELNDELKAIAKKVWRHKRPHFKHGGPRPSNQCNKNINDSMQSQHCADLLKVLAIEDLSDEFKTMIQERYDKFCTTSEE